MSVSWRTRCAQHKLLLQDVQPVVADVAVRRHKAAEVLAEQLLGGLLGAPRIDPVADNGGRRGRPQPAALALDQPRRLVGADGLGGLDRLMQRAPGVVQDPAHAAQHRVERPGAHLDPVAVSEQLGDPLPGEPVHACQDRDVGVQPGTERARRDPGRQLGQRRLAAAGALRAPKPPLADLGRDHRQLPLLVDDRIAQQRLVAAEALPAVAALRPAEDHRRSQLARLGRRAAGALVAGLGAPLAGLAVLALQLLLGALARQRPALLARQRRILRRRHRAVQRSALLKPLQILKALGVLVYAVQQPEHQLTRRLAARQRNRFCLGPIHDRKIPCAKKESSRSPRHPLNAYERTTYSEPGRGSRVGRGLSNLSRRGDAWR